MKFCTYQDVLNLIAEREWDSYEDDCKIICETIDQCWTCKTSKIIGLLMKDEVHHYKVEYNKKTKCLKLLGIARINHLYGETSVTKRETLLFNKVVSGYTGCITSPVPLEECNPPVGESNGIAICK